MTAIALILTLLTEPDPVEPKYDVCVEECEVLDMDFVRERGCVCVCWDPADRAYCIIDNPECVDRD
jgi:hypothetical protein